jgi:hypothetical protein
MATKTIVPRKKACQQCTVAKVRCDLKRPQCSRCETRRTPCAYAVDLAPAPSGGESNGVDHYNRGPVAIPRSIQASNSPGSAFSENSIRQTEPVRHPRNSEVQNQFISHGRHASHNEYNEYWASSPLSFAVINLICTIDPAQIRNRWLADFIPSLSGRVKIYPPGVSSFISRVLKTYPSVLLRKGQLPPFIHPSQLAGPDIPTPLANSLSLVRLWDGRVRGSETMVCETIKKEMDRLYREVCCHGMHASACVSN